MQKIITDKKRQSDRHFYHYQGQGHRNGLEVCGEGEGVEDRTVR